tara:strand:+ start:1844 stop:2065 length:222 start_codon:yes stop_codon:yes gene_type:complete
MNDEILYATNKSIKRRIDHLLRLMAIIFANCGKDSTNEELLIAYQKESAHMDEIKKLDGNFEKRIRPYGRSEH